MRNPILHAETLAWQSRCRSIRNWPARTWLGVAAMVLLGIALVAVWWSLTRAHASWLLTTAMLQPLATLGLCAALTCYIAMHERRRRYAQFARSWFTALPLSPGQLRVAAACPVAVRVMLVWLALALTIAVAAAVAHPAAKILVSLQLCFFLGAFFGGLLGWWMGRVTPHHRSNSLAWGRVGKALVHTDGLSIVSRWPLLQARSGVDPKVHARVFLPLLLGMPVGLPLAAIVFILAMSTLILLLIEIARGLLAVVPVAAHWLRSTPLTATVVMRALGQRAGLWFTGWLTVASAMLVGLGLPLPAACALIGCVVLALAAACQWRWPRLQRA
ncbi:MAG: hypothetical protein ABI304_04925 [Rudaea sp.]